jgi:hypothetical protein
MNFIKEVCLDCDPLRFDIFENPSDKHMYTGPYAMPQKYKHYKIDGEDVLYAKDELIQDTEDKWSNTVDEQALTFKRRWRRTEPLSRDEIKQTEGWALRELVPELIKRKLNARYGHVDTDG